MQIIIKQRDNAAEKIIAFTIIYVLMSITITTTFVNAGDKEVSEEILDKTEDNFESDVQQSEEIKNDIFIKMTSMMNDTVDDTEVVQENEYESNDLEIYEITAYTAGFESTGKHPSHPEYGITASGKKVKENHTIACPKSMEFGTKVYIEYFDNVFTCEDRGSAITEKHIDVYMENLNSALNFGRRKLEIKILKEEVGDEI